MKEEDILRKRFEGKEPFKVPEHFFENFTAELMDKLPEQEEKPELKITPWTRIKPWIYMAAMFTGLLFTVRLFVGAPHQGKTDTPIMASVDDVSDEEMNDIVSRTFMDDYSIYEYLTDAAEE